MFNSTFQTSLSILLLIAGLSTSACAKKRKDIRPKIYSRMEVLCIKNASLKMSKAKLRRICNCVIEEHKAKDHDLETVKSLYKIYSKSKTLRVNIPRSDGDVIAAYDSDTARDCINKYK